MLKIQNHITLHRPVIQLVECLCFHFYFCVQLQTKNQNRVNLVLCIDGPEVVLSLCKLTNQDLKFVLSKDNAAFFKEETTFNCHVIQLS